MQQRQLRLGDILDDYCPRERRLANHTIVAMVGDDIRLTRCTTCETEHPYKGGKVPRLRKKKTSVEEAYDEVLESVKHDGAPPGILVTQSAQTEPDSTPLEVPAPLAADGSNHNNNDNGNAPAETAPEEVRLHRPLIRAQLPRIEREPVARHSARVHHPAGEQEPRTFPEQFAPRALCEKRRPGGELSRAGRSSRPARRAAARPRLADAFAAEWPASGTEEAVAIEPGTTSPNRQSDIHNLKDTHA